MLKLCCLLLAMSLAVAAFPFKVFMVGDSHVSSRIYPEAVGDILVDADPEIDFDYWGKAGAGFYTFNESPAMMSHVYNAGADLLVVHLGTNDSYTRRFDKAKFLQDLSTFYSNVSAHCPGVPVVFVTPFFNKIKGSKEVNANTRVCAEAIREFAAGRDGIYVVDNNATHGMHFLNGGRELINRDNVHLTVEGYRELASQVGQALIDMDPLWQ